MYKSITHPCASINKVLFRNVVHAKSINVIKTHRFAFAFYHRSHNYGNRASRQSISRNNSIKSASLARKKYSPVRCEFYRRLFSASPPFCRISLFVHVEKFAVGISRSRINRDALVLWCLLKQTVAVTPAMSVVAFTPHENPIFATFIFNSYAGRLTTVRAADFEKIVICHIQNIATVDIASVFSLILKMRIYIQVRE